MLFPSFIDYCCYFPNRKLKIYEEQELTMKVFAENEFHLPPDNRQQQQQHHHQQNAITHNLLGMDTPPERSMPLIDSSDDLDNNNYATIQPINYSNNITNNSLNNSSRNTNNNSINLIDANDYQTLRNSSRVPPVSHPDILYSLSFHNTFAQIFEYSGSTFQVQQQSEPSSDYVGELM